MLAEAKRNRPRCPNCGNRVDGQAFLPAPAPGEWQVRFSYTCRLRSRGNGWCAQPTVIFVTGAEARYAFVPSWDVVEKLTPEEVLQQYGRGGPVPLR